MNAFTALVATIPTKRDLVQFLTELEASERGLFRVSADIEKFLSEQFPARVASALSAYAASQKVDLTDPSSTTEFLRRLRGDLQKVSVVTLRIAFEPSRAHLSNFSAWFSANSSQPVIFEFKYDPDVIGGAVVEHGGKIGDFSLAKKIDAYLHS